MGEAILSKKRIAKNTVMLYIRMLLSVVVSLYTSRVVLEVLGVEDYGLYGLVGGVVGLFSFLNTTMAGATSRFLTFEMGKGDEGRLKATFSSALIIHIGIAILVFLLSETVGLWFLNNKLVIPEGRMHAAHCLLQFSIMGMMVKFTQVPYNAAIIAHEKMDVYAYVELLNVFLKLGIVYLLSIGNFDKLILYAFLVMIVDITIAFIYRLYCIRHYKETKFSIYFDRTISKDIVSFSLYNLVGNMGTVVNTQGTAFILNNFFGLIYNAAATVSTTVSSVVTGFSSNIMTAFRPQITKSYAVGDLVNFQSLLSCALKVILLVYAVIAIPVGVCAKDILSFWLVDVPDHADIFCQLLLINIFFETSRYTINMGIYATGNVRLASLIVGVLFTINPLIVYILFSMDFPVAFAYITLIIINILTTIINIFILKSNDSRIIVKDIFNSFLKSTLAVFIAVAVSLSLYQSLHLNNLLNTLVLFLSSTFLLLLLGLYIVLDNNQRNNLINIVLKKLFAKS